MALTTAAVVLIAVVIAIICTVTLVGAGDTATIVARELAAEALSWNQSKYFG